MNSRLRLALSILGMCWTAGLFARDAPAPLPVEVQRIELRDVRGRMDHMAVDLAGKRLFVTALGNDSVEVVNLATGQADGHLSMQEPQGALFLPGSGRLVLTSGANDTVEILDATSLAPVRKVKLREDNDNVRLERATGLAYVGSGKGRDGALVSLNAQTGEIISSIALPGHPESFQLEAKGQRAFVNVPSAGSVEVVDRRAGRIVATWPVSARNNYPMALDEGNGRLFVGARSPARLLVLDTGTGKQIAGLPSVGDADDVFYDERLGRIYVAGGEGSLYVFGQIDPDHYELVGKVRTRAGARTALYVAEWRALFVAAPRTEGQSAALIRFDLGK